MQERNLCSQGAASSILKLTFRKRDHFPGTYFRRHINELCNILTYQVNGQSKTIFDLTLFKNYFLALVLQDILYKTSGKLNSNTWQATLDPTNNLSIPEYGNFLLVNLESLESGIQFKDSGIPLPILIRNSSITDKESKIHGMESRIQDCDEFPYTGPNTAHVIPAVMSIALLCITFRPLSATH